MRIYIHIPFCESKCPYCAFGSSSDKFKLVKSYFIALKKDLLSHKSEFTQIQSIFIGGGTPSAVDAGFYGEIFDVLDLNSRNNLDIEITGEANPNSANLAWLKQMREFGLNRVSFGAQSFLEQKLKFLGRIHDVKTIFKAVENAKMAGFENINVDLIYGTKFDTRKTLTKELENLAKLEITHVSAYGLSLEENTPFYGKKTFQKDSVNSARFFINGIENLGFLQYEISNFGRICEHNLGYWKKEDYLGFGAHSAGSMGNSRFYASKNIENYIKNPAQREIEILSKQDIILEKIFLGFRSKVGVALEILDKKQLEKIKILEKSKKIRIENGIAYNENFLLADEISLFLT